MWHFTRELLTETLCTAAGCELHVGCCADSAACRTDRDRPTSVAAQVANTLASGMGVGKPRMQLGAFLGGVRKGSHLQQYAGGLIRISVELYRGVSNLSGYLAALPPFTVLVPACIVLFPFVRWLVTMVNPLSARQCGRTEARTQKS